MRAYQRGDPAAFDALVRRYVRLAGAVAYAILGDYEHAADAVQEAFIKAHGALPDLREPERFKAWLSGVVRSTALDAHRRRRRAPSALSAIDGAEGLLPDGAPRPGAGAEERERSALIRAAVAALPESYREVVVMKYLDDMSYREICETLEITQETLESRLFRARKMLKGKLERFL